MEIFFFIIPWFLCIILFLTLLNQKKLRLSEQEHARNEIKTIENTAATVLRDTEMQLKAEAKNAEEEAQNKINGVLQETEDRIKQTEAHTYAELADMRKKTEQRIREEREAIRLNKESMQTLNEKELLIECLSALGTYAQRLDRLENRMSNMSIASDEIIRKSSSQKKPYIYTEGITDDDFIQIVLNASKYIERIKEITVNSALVRGTVLSQHKLSTWSFTIDFNDDGRLTGIYSIFSENDDSNIPQRLAQEISKEIVYRISLSNK